MDYQDVYYTDNRNATAVIDHRRGPQHGRFFGQPQTVAVQPAITPYAPMATPGFGPFGPQFAGAPGMASAWPSSWGSWTNPAYVTPPPGVNNLTSILGGFGDLGSLANIAAQVFAAFLPLPAPPTPQDGGDGSDPATNAQINSSNLIRFQNALAQFARRDQQILTVGSVLKELFKRPAVYGA